MPERDVERDEKKTVARKKTAAKKKAPGTKRPAAKKKAPAKKAAPAKKKAPRTTDAPFVKHGRGRHATIDMRALARTVGTHKRRLLTVSSPCHLHRAEQLRNKHQLIGPKAEPCDLFLWAQGAWDPSEVSCEGGVEDASILTGRASPAQQLSSIRPPRRLDANARRSSC